jgi:hypothetical protein
MGRLDGTLNPSKPIPAVFHLDGQEIDPRFFPDIGILLKSIREGDPENYIRTQMDCLVRSGLAHELLDVFLQSKIRVHFEINNGAGSRAMALDLIRFFKELRQKGAQVSTYGRERVISAGAYMLKVGDTCRVLDDTFYMIHTSLACKEEDAADIRSFLDTAKGPDKEAFLEAYHQDDDGRHEITTRGRVLARAGLVAGSFANGKEMDAFIRRQT